MLADEVGLILYIRCKYGTCGDELYGWDTEAGGKIEITDRIAYFLDTGKILSAPMARKKATAISIICEDTKIEANFVCSEKHRAFFREHIGSGFSFNVAFQKWLKNNTGKTYKEVID